MKATLVIMAAGMGSRYGGEKQTDGIGPHGEAIMEYSVYDAVRAGFHKIVFIIKPGMEPTIRALCGDRIETMHTPQGEPVEVAYAVQDFSSIPAFYTIPRSGRSPSARSTRPCAPGMWCGSPLLLSTPTTTTASRPMRPFCKNLDPEAHRGGGHGGVPLEKHRQRQRDGLPGGLPAGQRQPCER